jgi:hypothetical protein
MENLSESARSRKSMCLNDINIWRFKGEFGVESFDSRWLNRVNSVEF